MIVIKQDSHLDAAKLSTSLSRHDVTNVKINKQRLGEDAKRLMDLLRTVRKDPNADIGVDRNILEEHLFYLQRFVKFINIGGKLRISWVLSKTNEINAYPVDFRAKPELGVDSLNYIDRRTDKMLFIDCTDVCRAIAFSGMFRDLGYSNIDIENMLSEVGITALYPFSLVEDIIPENILEISEGLKIGDSPYICSYDMNIISYFNIALDAKTYDDVVRADCKYAVTLILLEILLESEKSQLKLEMCRLSRNGIYIMMKDANKIALAKERLEKEVMVRLFGRKFETKLKIHEVGDEGYTWRK